MQSLKRTQLSLLAVAVAAALAACGGGGGDSAPATGGGSTPAPTASAGDASGTPTDTTAPPPAITTPTGPRTPASLPAANVPVTTAPSNGYTGESSDAWISVQDWRSRMRSEAVQGQGGVGFLTQVAALTNAAQNYATSGTVPTGIAGYASPPLVSIRVPTANPNGVTPGNFCAKSMFANLAGVEIGSAGMRDAGMFVDTAVGQCALVAGLLTGGAPWQLPGAGSTSVYPFPGKTLVVTQYWGDFSATGLTARPGHPIFVSVASADALPAAIAGVGTGQPIATSEITVNQFELRLVDGNVLVPARLVVPAGVVRGPGVTATDTSAFRYPTSMALVPLTGLARNAAYSATFSGTVNGVAVSRTWQFTTADI